MSFMTPDQIHEFINALQLSIKTEIDSIGFPDSDNIIELTFSEAPKQDKNLDLFLKILSGQWNEQKTSYTINDSKKIDWGKLTYFLFITRLNIENIQKLTELDSSFKDIADKLGIKKIATQVSSAEDAARIIFAKVKDKKMTMRELSERSGLTQAGLSKFKSGGDIRLSSLLKITRVLGLRIKLK